MNEIKDPLNIAGNSPIYSHINMTLQGLATVRAFKAENFMTNEFYKYQDRHTAAAFLYSCSSKAFAMWVDIVCFAYISTIMYAVLSFDFGNKCMKSISSTHIVY